MEDKEQIDVGDENQVKKRRTKAQLRKENEDEAFRHLISDKRNRSVIWEFLKITGLNESVSMATSEYTLVRSGLRDAGLWWIKRMNEVDPNAFVLMQYEAIKEEEK